MSDEKNVLAKIILFFAIIAWLFLCISASKTIESKYKDYQIDVYNDNVILYDNGNIVSKGKLDSLPQMIIKDNL